MRKMSPPLSLLYFVFQRPHCEQAWLKLWVVSVNNNHKNVCFVAECNTDCSLQMGMSVVAALYIHFYTWQRCSGHVAPGGLWLMWTAPCKHWDFKKIVKTINILSSSGRFRHLKSGLLWERLCSSCSIVVKSQHWERSVLTGTFWYLISTTWERADWIWPWLQWAADETKAPEPCSSFWCRSVLTLCNKILSFIIYSQSFLHVYQCLKAGRL